MRIVLLSAIAIGAASCAPLYPDRQATPAAVAAAPSPEAPAWGFPFSTPPRPPRLALSNFSFDRATVQAVATAVPGCETPGAAIDTFALPLNATRLIEPPLGTDVCWRREVIGETASTGAPAPPHWTEWNRAYLSAGRSVDSRL